MPAPGAAADTGETLLARGPLLPSCRAARFLTGHRRYRSTARGLGTPAWEDDFYREVIVFAIDQAVTARAAPPFKKEYFCSGAVGERLTQRKDTWPARHNILRRMLFQRT